MTEPKPLRKIYFENLDALRTIAFLMVFVSHAKLNMYFEFASPTVEALSTRLMRLGPLGVNLFFVLSGFLITYLLLREQEDYQRIHIGRFYMRRVLRIWPLYYTVVLLSLAVVPWLLSGAESIRAESARITPGSVWMYILYLVNFDHINYGINFRWSTILWSVSVEEQFYLFWPVLLYVIPRRRLPLTFFLLIVTSFVFRGLHYDHYRATHYHTLAVLNDLVIGGAIAYVSLYHRRLLGPLREMRRNWILLVYVAGAVVLLGRDVIFAEPWLVPFSGLVASLYFGFAIAEQMQAKHSPFKLSNWRTGTSAGKYTYSLYCLHFFSIYFVNLVSKSLSLPQNNLPIFLAKVVVALTLSFATSWLSYRFLETPFLRLKSRFAFFRR